MRHLNVRVGCGVTLTLALLLARPNRLLAQPTTAPGTAPAAEEGWTADNFRARADALWSVKQDYASALKTYRRGIDRFPTNVRILVSLAATSIDFGWRHPESDAGRSAYKEARVAIDKAQGLIRDGTGQDVDDGAENSLAGMARQLP